MIVLPLERTIRSCCFFENKCIYLFVCLKSFEGIQIFETKKAKKISTCYNMKSFGLFKILCQFDAEVWMFNSAQASFNFLGIKYQAVPHL